MFILLLMTAYDDFIQITWAINSHWCNLYCQPSGKIYEFNYDQVLQLFKIA